MPPPPPPWVIDLKDDSSKLYVKADIALYKTNPAIVALAQSFTRFDLVIPIKKLIIKRNVPNPNLYEYTWEAVDGRSWDQKITLIGPLDASVNLDALAGDWRDPELIAHVAFRAALVAFSRAFDVDRLDYDRL